MKMKNCAAKEEKICSAGILPFAIAPNAANDIYVLLGKEENIPGWNFGSHKWCDFSGGTDRTDIDVETTAAREFVEESMAVVPLKTNPYQHYQTKTYIENSRSEKHIYIQVEDVYQDLKEGNYTHKITMMKPIKTEDHCVLKCVCYLKRIPWQPELPAHFDAVRYRLFHIRSLSRRYQESISEFPTSVPLPGGIMRNENQTPKSKISIVVNMHLSDQNNGIRYAYWTEGEGIKYQIIHFNQIGQLIKENSLGLNISARSSLYPPAEMKMRKVVDLWQRLRHAFYLLPYCMRDHPALDIKMVPNTALIISVSVKNCYLEKESAIWWSLPRLSEVIQHGGSFRGEMFRPNFLPYLAVVLDILKKYSSSSSASKRKEEYEVNVVPWRSKSTSSSF